MSELPRGWTRVTLGDVVSPRKEKADPKFLDKMPFIGMDNIEAHSSRLLGTVPVSSMRSAVALFHNGDVLYGRLRPYLNKVYRADFDGAASAEFIVIPGNQAINPDFLQQVLRQPEFVSFASHINKGDRPRVSFEDIAAFEFNLPPFTEQRRIVAKLDNLFARTRKAREELAHIPILIEHYKQAILAAAFRGDLTADWRKAQDCSFSTITLLEQAGIASLDNPSLPAIPNTWAWVATGDLCEIKSGITLGKKRKPNDELIELPYLRVANVQRGWINLSEIKTIFVTPQEAEALYLRDGDILMNEGGDRDKLGRGWVWSGELPQCIHQNHVFRLRLRTDIVPSRYISYYANEFGQPYFLSQGKQTTNLASISKSKLSGLPLPIALPEEAALIVKRIENAIASLSIIHIEAEKAAKHLDHLDQASLAKAFRGELVAQDPNDEPANALLERIRAERGVISGSPRGRSRIKTRQSELTYLK